MPTIFFSWQSDAANADKNFIAKALQAAIKQISKDLELDEDPRDPLELDKHTKGVPGSPKTFDTIVAKIERSAVFVADLTFVASRPKGEPCTGEDGVGQGCANEVPQHAHGRKIAKALGEPGQVGGLELQREDLGESVAKTV